MANPSVTYTFSNGTTADATQINTNYTDLINSLTDGTKSLSIDALTCAGAVTLNGNVTLGNASVDDIAFTGSINSSLLFKTTFDFDIGSATVGARSLYLGSNDDAARSVRLIAPAVGSSYTFTFPTGAGSAGDRLLNTGSGTVIWLPDYSGESLKNYSISTSVGSSALTIALKDSGGSDPSSSSPVEAIFRNATSATGTPVRRTVTGALSVVISSGSTLGHVSAVNEYIYVYLLDNAGTVELAASSTRFDEGSIQSTTAEGGAGAADSRTTMYSTTSRANVAVRLIARLKSNQAAAGTWATGISEVSLGLSNKYMIPISEVVVHTGNGYGSTNTKIRRFTTTEVNTGSAITYADSAGNGASFTINEYGLYSISYTDGDTGSNLYIGASRNSNQLTTNIDTITVGHRISLGLAANGLVQGVHVVRRLEPGDVIRPHTQGAAATPDATAKVKFTILKISD